MKKIEFFYECDFHYLKKTFKIMRITVFLLIVSILQTFANDTYSQSARLSLNFSNAKLVDVMDEIEELSEFYFLFNEKLIETDREVSMSVNNQRIDKILDKLFSETDVIYTITDRKIILAPSFLSEGGQQQKISGTITDESGQPLPGVTVTIKGTTQGTVTNTDGNYSISNIPENVTLVFSFVGMRTQEIEVADQTTINVTMQTDAIGLEEVVAIGYGTQKKINLTGAVAQVKSTEFIEERPVTSVGQALMGVIPGLTVTKGSGKPGDPFDFNIRGTTSLNGGGPLVLVDGTEMDPNLVPPEDIESVSVLKDAASAAIYGSRAAFGVIIITTKSGKTDRAPRITYTGNVNFSAATGFPDKVDPITQIEVGTIMWTNGGSSPGTYYGKNSQTWLDLYKDGTYVNYGAYVDDKWYPLGQENMLEHLTETSVSHTHNLSVSGGSQNSTYYLSVGAMENDGILTHDKDKYLRKNILGKIDTDINKYVSVGATIGFTQGTQKMPWIPNGEWYLYNIAYGRIPMWIVGMDENTGLPWGFGAEMANLGADTWTTTNNTNIQTRVTIKPFTGLELNGTYSYRNTTMDDHFHVNTYAMQNPTGGPTPVYYKNIPNSIKKTASFTEYDNLFLTGTYTKTFDDSHNMKLLVGYSQEEYKNNAYSAERRELISDAVPALAAATGLQSVDDWVSSWATRSGFSRLNYNYDGKYLLEVVARYDGSSRFAEGNRGVFSPSASLGWIVSDESFMQGANSWLSYLKVRGSYGLQGNQNIGPYDYTSTMDSGTANWMVNGQRPLYVGADGLVSDLFTWEKVYTTNFGIDFHLFDSKLQATAEVYSRETKGMLTESAELPSVLGTNAPDENAADLRVNGWELSLNWKDRISDDFSYNVGLILYDYKTEITKFEGNNTNYVRDYYVGSQLGEIYGYVTDRLFQEDDFVINSDGKRDYAPGIARQDRDFKNTIPFPGDVKYKDLNGDGVINVGERTLDDLGDTKVIGNDEFRYQTSLRLGATYKAFDLQIFMQGVLQRDLWTSGALAFTSPGAYAAILSHTLDYWTPENTDAFYPRPSTKTYSRQVQSQYLLNAAFLRFKNIKLGYNMPKNIVGKIGLESVKVYVTGENLFTITGMPEGVDPEVGVSNTVYPYRKDFAIGTTITF